MAEYNDPQVQESLAAEPQWFRSNRGEREATPDQGNMNANPFWHERFCEGEKEYADAKSAEIALQFIPPRRTGKRKRPLAVSPYEIDRQIRSDILAGRQHPLENVEDYRNRYYTIRRARSGGKKR